MFSAYDRYWAGLPTGIPIPSENEIKPPKITEGPYIPPVRPAVNASTPHSIYSQLPRPTPWTQPYTVPDLPTFTPTYPAQHAQPPQATPQTPFFRQLPPSPWYMWPPTQLVPNPAPHLETPNQSGHDLLEPGTWPGLSFGTAVPLRLHPHLIYNPVEPNVPTLKWDLSHLAEQAKRVTGRLWMVSLDLSAQATVPAVSRMVIYGENSLLAQWMKHWGPIVIEKPEISVRDVLDAISDYMRVPLTAADLRRVEKAGGKFQLDIAAISRIRDGYDLPDVARRCGYRRVDVLGSLRRFLGLRVHVNQLTRTFKVYMGLTTAAASH